MNTAKPGIWRYLAIISYDLILLSAIWFFTTLLILPLNHGEAFTAKDYFYPVYLLAVSFCFYGWFWTHGGQTLGLKTWKCKVVSTDGKPVSWRRAFIRFTVAVISLSCLGLGFIWKLIDKQGRSWQDLISKTELFAEDENILLQHNDIPGELSIHETYTETENQSEIEESFYLSFDWFYKELDALRHPPVEACELEGNFDVAHQIWYLLPNEHLLENPIGVFSQDQLKLLTDLFNEVKSIPPEARIGTIVAEESVKNMSHPAWDVARAKAQTVYLELAPVAKACQNYFRNLP